MANHGFITTRKFLKTEKIDADIREFVKKHFGDLADVEGPGEGWEGVRADWQIQFKGDDYSSFSVWLQTQRKLEFRHPRVRLSRWAQALVQEELATRYDGMISDEGVEGRWKPDVEKLNTYRKWVNLMTSHTPRLARPMLRKLYTNQVPENLRSIPSFGKF